MSLDIIPFFDDLSCQQDMYRCYRNCFNCPVCVAPLTINSINPDPVAKANNGPWIMNCGFCNWKSLDIGWQFDKLTNLHQQMSKMKIGGQEKASPRNLSETEATPEESSGQSTDGEHGAMFASLRSFYNSQLSAANPNEPLLTPSGGYNYSSPASLARIMSLYTGRSFYGKKGQGKPAAMREASDSFEGLRVIDRASDEGVIQKLRNQGWTGTASVSQQAAQQQFPSKFTDELKPLRVQLHTKRSKRCRTCRHILVKPEPKVQSVRFRIRLLALNYIPTISFKPLHPSPSTKLPLIDLNALPALKASQFLLTLKNPLYETIKITLATSAQTPGRYGHKVTILCPQFDVGPNVDQWDEVLGDSKGHRSGKPFSATRIEYAGGDNGKVAEAGKVWDKERNWTTVVVEVVCAAVGGQEEMVEDEDLLEIPVFVRMEWEAEVERDEGGGKLEGKEKRELAYWTVIGVGRVRRLESSGP